MNRPTRPPAKVARRGERLPRARIFYRSPLPPEPGRILEAARAPADALEARAPSALAPPAAERAVWWLRILARLPLAALYGGAQLLAWIACGVVSYRKDVIEANVSQAFPELSETTRRALRRRYYAGMAQMSAELIKAVAASPAEVRRRVRTVNIDKPRALLARGQSVLLLAAHQCNWEWMLLALSLELGYPLEAAYKPLANEWADREIKKLRTRFGSRLVPAKDLLPDILKRQGTPRAIAMIADQEPTTAERKYWTRFLNRETAFYTGPEEIARITRFPVFFVAMRRHGRGFYEMGFLRLPDPALLPFPGSLTERYARLVEEQIHSARADWLWSHRRWKLKRSLYQSR